MTLEANLCRATTYQLSSPIVRKGGKGYTILKVTFESGEDSRSIFRSGRNDHTLDNIIYHQHTSQLEEELTCFRKNHW